MRYEAALAAARADPRGTMQDAEALIRQAARRDYLTWCEEVGADRGWSPASHHKVIIQAVEETISGRGPNRLLINAPPGSAKSTYTSELLPAHVLSRWPGFNLIGASNTSTLAEDFSDRTLALIDQRPDLVPFRLRKRSAQLWTTTDRGRYRAAGVGVAIAGNRADGVLIDDPVKSREAADSETQREKVWNWFISDLRTRLKPGAWIIVIMCLVGETPVRMADGTERPLRDVRPGDEVLSLDRATGAFVPRKVLNWCSQGDDDILEVLTSGGRTVRGNRRHPFLVCREGVTEWVKLGDLRPGDMLVKEKPWPNGAPYEAWSASNRVAQMLQNASNGVCPATANGGEATVFIPRLRFALRNVANAALNTAMGWCRGSTNGGWLLKGGGAPFAANPPRKATPGRIGAANSALTTITQWAQRVACSAIRATYSWGIAKSAPRFFGERERTSSFSMDEVASITPAGRAEVFDIEVEGAHNFFADGLCVSNTRWHEDDLGGRLIERQPGLWRVLNIPAQAFGMNPDTGEVPVDPLGRAPGAWLWGDDDYGYAGALNIIKGEYEAAGAMRDWNALYQGRPTAGDGAVFKVGHLEVVEGVQASRNWICRAWDLAATKKMGTADPDWTVGVKVQRTAEGRYVILDVVRERVGPEGVERLIKNTADADGRHVKVRLPQDPGQAGKAQVRTLAKMLAGYSVTAESPSGDKATRAAPAAAQVNIGNVSMVRAPWNAPFREELAAFPSGSHDDQVDAFADAFSMVALNRPLVISDEALRDMKYGLRRKR